MKLAVFFIAGWVTMGALLAVATVGKPRKALSPFAAAVAVVIDAAAIVVALVLAAMRLS